MFYERLKTTIYKFINSISRQFLFCFIGYKNTYSLKSTYSLIIWGWRKSFRFWISRFIFPTTSKLRIFCLFRILTATLWPVNWCSPTTNEEKKLLIIHSYFHCNPKFYSYIPLLHHVWHRTDVLPFHFHPFY